MRSVTHSMSVSPGGGIVGPDGRFGRPLFDDCEMPIELGLFEYRSFQQGVTTHRDVLRDAQEASSC
ncbi:MULTISPECIES: hypothetical protein [unclassified Nonomuraea]|jgi:hypothetical protein|uniref:hypothetical protein n=1 Tax=unclassified Nonomuraea TaxID=2593643 RepID=UPI0033EB7083